MELLNKTYSIIPKQQKFKVLIILVLILVQVLLEMIGLGLVIPLISIILDINLFYDLSCNSASTHHKSAKLVSIDLVS